LPVTSCARRGQEQAAAVPREVEWVAQRRGGEGGGEEGRRAVVGLRAERYRVLVGKWRELGGLPPKSLGVRSVL
jgi:hypothetical protein